jgi:hypothetical protein
MKSPMNGVPTGNAKRQTGPAIAAEDCLYRNCLIPMKDIYVFVQQGRPLIPTLEKCAARRPGQVAFGSWQSAGDRLSTFLPGGRNPFPCARPGPSGHLPSAIAAVWWWLATPIVLAHAPIDPAAKLECVSYAPFREGQNPLQPGLVIAPEQMAQDLAQLAKVTGCIRTYSVGNGLDRVPELAEKAVLR